MLQEEYELSQGSIRLAAGKLDINQSSIQRMLREDIKVFSTSLEADDDHKVEINETSLNQYVCNWLNIRTILVKTTC